MKAIIPVAGAGTKLRPLTYTQPKPLIPVAGKPIIAFIIDQLKEVGVKDFVFIIGYLGEKIQMYVEKSYPDINKVFVQQKKREGLGHAIWSARKNLEDTEEVVIVLGDTIFDIDLKSFIDQPYTCIGIMKVDDPREFGVVEMDEEGFIIKVIEKPKIPKSNLAIVGIYKIKEVDLLIQSLEYLIDNNLRTIGEFQLTDALMLMIDKDVKIIGHGVDNWYDCGKKEILLKTNAILLDRKEYATSNIPAFDNSIIIQPVAIGKHCTISHSIVGPHVTIGDNVKISSAILKESIIGNYSSIEEVVLHRSVVGSDAAIKGGKQSLNIGDNTEIDLS